MWSSYGKIFSAYENIMKYADPRIKNYFLMETPFLIIFLLFAYLIFVFKIGPSLMKNRPAMKLDGVIMVYNWVQILSNGAMFLVGFLELSKYNLSCVTLDKSNSPDAIRMLHLQYSYALLKILDLLDTVFFVLRKKYNQVTFLHVYHHVLMAVASWISCKFFIGGPLYYLGMANVFVHTVMYFYYFVTSWKSKYKNNIWWKKYITQLQIVQHCFIFTVFAIPFFNSKCSYPKTLLGLFLTQSILMICLFVNFYRRMYLQAKEKTT